MIRIKLGKANNMKLSNLLMPLYQYFLLIIYLFQESGQDMTDMDSCYRY